jgi:formate hydrogenlyase transcriptional activator
MRQEEFDRLAVFANQAAIAIKNAQLFTEVEALKNRLQAENRYLQEEIKLAHNFDEIIGRSAALTKVLRLVEQVAATDATVLILGETGTGKELVARAVHHLSARRQRPLVKVNCAALPAPLLESELFGHERGAFTGATAQKIGRFELAHGGTIFLDEIGELPLESQVKLLRVLQDGEFERVGGARTVHVDVRVMAATNRPLDQAIAAGTFREDLYYRLNVIPITLPPLRERREDIPLIARHFVQKSCKSNNLQVKTLTQEAVRAIMSYSWPGNIRQLENAIEHAVAMSGQEREIPATALPSDVLESSGSLLLPAVAIPDEGINFTSVVSQLERELITRCLDKTGGNKRQAARLLNLSRTTLIDKLHRLNIAAATEPTGPVAN